MDRTICSDALQGARICSYAQGMALIAAGSREYSWNVNLAEMARIWKGGCIIRARLLDPVRAAFTKNPSLPNLLVDAAIAADMERAAHRLASASSPRPRPPAFPFPRCRRASRTSTATASPRLPQNLTQAQRDAFGAHKYERVERPGFVHSDWQLS